MNNWVFISLILSFFTNCTTSIDINKLNGYWEIDEVVLKNGAKKEYSVNTTIDYIELASDSTGIRTKLYPLADGTYQTTNDRESFKIKTNQNGTFIEYSTDLDRWTEQIEKLNENRLIIKNDNSIRYIYKRFEKYELQ